MAGRTIDRARIAVVCGLIAATCFIVNTIVDAFSASTRDAPNATSTHGSDAPRDLEAPASMHAPTSAPAPPPVEREAFREPEPEVASERDSVQPAPTGPDWTLAVRDESGALVAGLTIHVRSGDPHHVLEEATTDSTGTVVFKGIADQSLEVSLEAHLKNSPQSFSVQFVRVEGGTICPNYRTNFDTTPGTRSASAVIRVMPVVRGRWTGGEKIGPLEPHTSIFVYVEGHDRPWRSDSDCRYPSESFCFSLRIDGNEMPLDAVVRRIRVEAKDPAGNTVSSATHEGPIGAELDFGDIPIVANVPETRVRIVDDEGAPLVGAVARWIGRANYEIASWRPDPDEPHVARFPKNGGDEILEFRHDGLISARIEDPPTDGTIVTVKLPRSATIRLSFADRRPPFVEYCLTSPSVDEGSKEPPYRWSECVPEGEDFMIIKGVEPDAPFRLHLRGHLAQAPMGSVEQYLPIVEIEPLAAGETRAVGALAFPTIGQCAVVGRLTDADGVPVNYRSVTVERIDDGGAADQGTRFRLRGSHYCENDGMFRFDKLHVGRYEFAQIDEPFSVRAVVDVVAGRNVVDLQRPPHRIVEVAFVDQNGVPTTRDWGPGNDMAVIDRVGGEPVADPKPFAFRNESAGIGSTSALVRLPRGADAILRFVHLNGVFEVRAPDGISPVRLVLPRPGALTFAVPRVPVADQITIELRPIDAPGAIPETSNIALRALAAYSESTLVTRIPGRYAVEIFRESDQLKAPPRSPPMSAFEVVVRPGEDTVVDIDL